MRLLETHPCQGGATAGYKRAGWHVTAVDIAPRHQKYSPADEYVIADAAAYIYLYGAEFDAIHVSPPCQWYSRGNAKDRGKASKWERTIPPMREALLSTGRPYVMENVEDAGWDMQDPTLLCGCMFDLSAVDYSCNAPGQHDGTCDTVNGVTVHLQRPRLFEASWDLKPPRPCDHSQHEWVAGAYGGARRDKWEAKYVRKGGYVPPDKTTVKALLGVEHDMTWEGLFECVPPPYAEYVGRQLAAAVIAMRAAA